MTWDLQDKYLALSLLHDNELPPADRAAVEQRLTVDADWRETYQALQETERRLAANLRRRAADPLGAAIEATLERYLRDHRLHADAFPAQLLKQAFPNLVGAWLDRVLAAHRLDDAFVTKVSDAIRIAGFQEPLDAQLREAFQAHRVGAAFLERVVGESQGNSKPVADLPSAAPASASGRTPSLPPPTLQPATTAAVSPTPGRGATVRRDTPNRSLTPTSSQRSARSAAGATNSPKPATAKALPIAAFRRWAPFLAAAVVVLALSLGYWLFPDTSVTPMQPIPLLGSPLAAQVYSTRVPTGTTASPVTVAGVAGYYPVAMLSVDRRTVSSAADAGRLIVLTDPLHNTPIARIFLDADTTVALYGPGEQIPGVGELPRGGVVLTRGSLLADVDKSGQSFQVLTPAVRAGVYDAVVVHGTRFSVRADGAQSAVDVLEGRVRYIAAADPAAQMPVQVDLPAGSRLSRDRTSGVQRLQRLDPADMIHAFAPAALNISRWPQAGGGLERGNQTDAPFFASFTPSEILANPLPVVGAPVLLPDGRNLCLAQRGDLLAWNLLDAAGHLAAIEAAPPVSGRLRMGPVLMPRQVVALVVDQSLRAFHTVDFQPVWRVDLPADLDLHALSAGPRGMLVLSTSQGLLAYDGATGAPLWRNSAVGEITSGIAATERADPAFLVAYDSRHAALHLLDADGRLLKTLELRGAEAAPAGGLAQDLKNWTLHAAPCLAGNNCILAFEDGATALVNLTTGARRMTAGFGPADRLRFATLDRRDLSLTVVLQSNQAHRIDLTAARAPEPLTLPVADPVHLLMTDRAAWTVDLAGRVRLWQPTLKP